MQSLVRHKRKHSGAKGLLSALGPMEKLRLVKHVVKRYHCLQVEAIEELHNKPHKIYAIAEDLGFLAKSLPLWGWDMVFLLATCSVVYGMRVEDAGQGQSTGGVWTPQKGMGGIPIG